MIFEKRISGCLVIRIPMPELWVGGITDIRLLEWRIGQRWSTITLGITVILLWWVSLLRWCKNFCVTEEPFSFFPSYRCGNCQILTNVFFACEKVPLCTTTYIFSKLKIWNGIFAASVISRMNRFSVWILGYSENYDFLFLFSFDVFCIAKMLSWAWLGRVTSRMRKHTLKNFEWDFFQIGYFPT